MREQWETRARTRRKVWCEKPRRSPGLPRRRGRGSKLEPLPRQLAALNDASVKRYPSVFSLLDRGPADARRWIPAQASNIIGGQEGARESQKLAFEKKKAMIENLVAQVDNAFDETMEEESPRESPRSEDASPRP